MLLSFLVVAISVSAQPTLSKEFKITNSEPYIVVDADVKQYFADNNGFSYSIKTNRNSVIVQKFEIQSMKEVARNEYKDLPPYNKVIDIVQIGDNYYYLFESFENKTQTRLVHLREFLTKDCSLGKDKILFASDGEVADVTENETYGNWGLTIGYSSFKVIGSPFKVYESFDHSKIMINYRRNPLMKSDKANHDLLGFFVFNASFDLIWGREVKMPYSEKEMNNIAYTVGSDGTVYMMSLYREQKDFRLLTIPQTGDLTVKVVDRGDFTFKNLYIQETKDGNLDFLGYYATGIEYKFWEGSWGTLSFNTNGIRYFQISKQGEILKSKNVEFPIGLINKYESEFQRDKNEKREEEGKAGIRDLVLRKFTVNPDGSIFILGEQYYFTQKFNTQTFQMTYQFYYEDLVATKLNADGEVLWMQKLPKRQFGTQGRRGMGIAYLKGNNSHYILFLDNVKNANIDINTAPAKHTDGKGGYLTAYKIDDITGNYSKYTLYNSLEVNGVKTYQFQTSRILQASDNVLLVEVYIKNKKDMMIKMELVN